MIKDKNELLIEIGVEELPASYIEPALESWLQFVSSRLLDLKLHPFAVENAVTYSTPRRLALHIKDIRCHQEDEEVERVGPSIRVAFDDNGQLKKGGQGFLRGANVVIPDVDSFSRDEIDKLEGVFIKQTDKGEYLAVKQIVKGKMASELLIGVCKESLSKILFPKMMRWKDKGFRFARPIRWIVALWGSEVLSFEATGVDSGNITYGNVLEKEAAAIKVNKIDNYLTLLEENFVIADRKNRFEMVVNQVNAKAREGGGEIVDNGLLEEVTNLVEYPTAVLSEFDKDFLKLPVQVIHSTLAKNQRYFPVYNDDKKLLNRFVYVANNLPENAENTRAGNERVVKARLSDARFYYDEDKSKSIDYFNEKLDGIVFHAKLGTIQNKVERIAEISDYLCQKLGVDSEIREKVLRAATVCKFDLTTAMIGEKEFTGLQGYIGKEYALLWGEEKEITRAIEEHYLPVGLDHPNQEFGKENGKDGINNTIPSNIIGQIVSLADKLDTLCAFFGIGIVPSGSKDQYGLRRAGNSIVKLIYEAVMQLSLRDLVDFINILIRDRFPELFLNKSEKEIEAIKEGERVLWDFLKQRIDQYLQRHKIEYDVIKAVLGTDFDDVVKVVNRAIALQKVRKREDFEHLMLSFKRVSNIIAAEKKFSKVDKEALKETPEEKMFAAINKAEQRVDGFLKDNNYDDILEEFIALNPFIDSFFDNVLVNVDDESIRHNRYNLLNKIRSLFLIMGDLSLIVVV